MSKGKYYIKMIALGLVVGVVLVLACTFGGQLYHKTMAAKCIDRYNETHDISVLADGFYHISFCNDKNQTVQQQFLFYTKELADCGEWNSYYPNSKYGQKNGDAANPEMSMKLAHLHLALLYGNYDEYIEGFTKYFPDFDISAKIAFNSMLCGDDFLKNSEWQEIYTTVVNGYVSLAEKADTPIDKAKIYTDLAVLCELVGNENDAETYRNKSNEIKQEAFNQNAN